MIDKYECFRDSFVLRARNAGQDSSGQFRGQPALREAGRHRGRHRVRRHGRGPDGIQEGILPGDEQGHLPAGGEKVHWPSRERKIK